MTFETTFEHARLMQLANPMTLRTMTSLMAITQGLKLLVLVLVLVAFTNDQYIALRLSITSQRSKSYSARIACANETRNSDTIHGYKAILNERERIT